MARNVFPCDKAKDLEIYRYYMQSDTTQLPAELPESMMLELPPLEDAPVVKTELPYHNFVDLVGRMVLKKEPNLVLDPWKLWGSLDPKQRLVENPTSLVSKAMRRTHPGVEYEIGPAVNGRIPLADQPLRLYRGVICCLASESEHFSSCLQRGGGYARGIPTIISSGGIALVKGDIGNPSKLYKRIWLYLNHDMTGFCVGRPSYGAWQKEELADALRRVEKALEIPCVGTFYSETANMFGAKQLSRSRAIASDASDAPFKTAWFTVRPEWKAPYTDGMEARVDPKQPHRQCLVPPNWFPFRVSAPKTDGKKATDERVLKVKFFLKGDDLEYSVLEQSHKNEAFNIGGPNSTEFYFRGVQIVSDSHPEVRLLHSDPIQLFALGNYDGDLLGFNIPYKLFAENDAEKAAAKLALAKVMAAVRAYNTNPTTDPVEFVCED